MSDAAKRAGKPATRIVDIVLRVHRDPRPASDCLASVLAATNDTPFEVIVAIDAGVAAEFEALAAAALRDPRVRVVVSSALDGAIENALASHGERDIVLLEPGADVHGDWLDRLAFHARGAGVGIVGTFTNANGSATYPRAGERNALPVGETNATLDALFSRTNRGHSVEVAEVYGPCRYVTRECAAVALLQAVAAGDDRATASEASRRAARAGFRSRVAGDVFVGASGGPVAHEPPPDAAKDLIPFARRVDLARLAASPRPAIVFVSHAWGGGIRRHMDDLAALAGARADVLYVQPADGDNVKLHWPRAGEAFAAWFRLPAELPALADALRAIGVARVHFHHVHGLPRSILDLPRAIGVPYDCTLHDYFAICPQYHLADERGRYCGEPDAAGCAACLAQRPAQWGLDIAAWREAFAAFLADAARVIAPSHDVEMRIHRHFPALPIDVWPHPEAAPATPPSIARVVTLGNLTPEKGLHVVAACARDARLRDLPLTFRVLGATSEPLAQSPDAPLTIHGSYAEDRLAPLLAAERADVVFFPAQVPETYSYTLSVALATDTPIVASALGALTERLAGRPRVRMLPHDADPARWNDALLDVVREAARHPPTAVAGIVPLRAAS
jgi:glycosyltransferase involved in cell wall biosynthesis